jgi:hypothetical protein
MARTGVRVAAELNRHARPDRPNSGSQVKAWPRFGRLDGPWQKSELPGQLDG